MKKIFLFAGVMILASACSPSFTPKSSEYADIMRLSREPDNPKPEWVGKEYWGEGGYVYAVGKSEKTPAGLDIQLRLAEIEARQKFLEFSKTCSVTIVKGVLLKSWTDDDGTVYALVRASGVIPWESCRSPNKRF